MEEEKIIRKFFQSDEWLSSEVIGLTKSMDYEFSTDRIIAEAFKVGKRVAVPKVYSDGIMAFIEILPGTRYEMTKFGVEEPVSGTSLPSNELSVIIVPGVLFKPDGYRIGFGGGFYDRFLETYSGQTVSLVFSYQIAENWNEDSYDQPVKKLFTIN